MPINLFGNSSSSYDNGNKTDTSVFVQNLYLRTNYIEANMKADTDLKNQLQLKIYLIICPYKKLVVKIMLIIYATILVY